MSASDRFESLLPEAATATTAEQVARAYQVTLRRPVDEDGLQTYCGLVDAGRWTILDVVEDLLGSAEYAPPRSALEPSPQEPDPQKSQAALSGLVDGMYRTVLGREADPPGLAVHVSRLESGACEASHVLEELLASDEYAQRFARRGNVAHELARTLIIGVTGRDPGVAAIDNYAGAVANGYPLADFLAELMASPEVARHAPPPSPAPAGDSIPVELVILAQELIAAHMTAQGGIIALPPMPTAGAAPVSTRQMALLIRTMAMLATVRT